LTTAIQSANGSYASTSIVHTVSLARVLTRFRVNVAQSTIFVLGEESVWKRATQVNTFHCIVLSLRGIELYRRFSEEACPLEGEAGSALDRLAKGRETTLRAA
jgi:hypothetical protein